MQSRLPGQKETFYNAPLQECSGFWAVHQGVLRGQSRFLKSSNFLYFHINFMCWAQELCEAEICVVELMYHWNSERVLWKRGLSLFSQEFWTKTSPHCDKIMYCWLLLSMESSDHCHHLFYFTLMKKAEVGKSSTLLKAHLKLCIFAWFLTSKFN